MTLKKFFYTAVFQGFSLFAMTGCSSDVLSSALKSVTSFEVSSVWLQKVSFEVSDKVNDCSPVLVHIVIPYTKDLFKSLASMKAAQYFSNSKQIKLDNAGKVDIFEWELIRSQVLKEEPVKPSKFSGEGVVIFANYSTPGDHRQTLGDDEHVLVKLEDKDFVVQSIKK